MRYKKQENEFHITVNGQKLEEIKAKDGHTYVTMPLFSKVSYGVEFKEEIKGHGAVETVSQQWPVCPYQVVCRNLSGKIQKAKLYVDGHQVGRKHLKPFGSHVFEGIPTGDGVQELLFSLPRFVTLKEKSGGDIGGLKGLRAKEIGTVKIVWREAVQIGSEVADNHRSYTTNSFTQANKVDAKATGGGAGSGSSEKSHASTTRAGKVIRLKEPRKCRVARFNDVGERKEARLLYRTQHHLEDMGVLEKREPVVESAERKSKRERRRKRAKLTHASSSAPPPVPVEDVKAERPPPVPTDDDVIVL